MNFFERVEDFLSEKLNITKENKSTFLTLAFIVFVLLSFVIFVSPIKVFGLLIAAVFLIVCMLRPAWIVFFLAVFIPFEPFLLKFVPDDLYVFARYFSEVLIYLLLLSSGWKLIIRDKKYFQTPIDLPFILFLLVLAASAVVNFVPVTIATLGIRQIIRFILLYYAVSFLGINKKIIKMTIFAMFIIVLFQSALGLSQAVLAGRLDSFLAPTERKVLGEIQLTAGTQQPFGEGSRIFATMGRYDQLGTFLCFFLLLAVGLRYQVKEKNFKLFLSILPFLGIPALILTYSRASWFGFLFGFILISIIIKKDKRFLFLFIGSIFALIVYLLYSGIVVHYLIDVPSQTILERFFEAFSYERWRGEYYGLGRLYFIVNTIVMVLPHFFLFGAGPGQYGGGAAAALHNTTVYDKLGLPFGVYGTEGYIDNNWLSLLGETGILGFVFYASIFFVLFVFAYRVYKKSKSKFTQGLCLGFLGCILAVSFQAFLGTYLEVRTLALYFWLLAAFIVTLARQEEINIFK